MDHRSRVASPRSSLVPFPPLQAEDRARALLQWAAQAGPRDGAGGGRASAEGGGVAAAETGEAGRGRGTGSVAARLGGDGRGDNRPGRALHSRDTATVRPGGAPAGAEPPGSLRRLEVLPDDPNPRFWILVALAGTDTAGVRRAWSQELNRACNVPSLIGTRLAWFALARALVGGWLTWPEFRDGLTAGRALAAVNRGRAYRRPLERLGLWSHPNFAKWYRQVVYEVVTQPDVSLSYGAGGWIRDLPGEEYLFEALARLQEDPEPRGGRSPCSGGRRNSPPATRSSDESWATARPPRSSSFP